MQCEPALAAVRDTLDLYRRLSNLLRARGDSRIRIEYEFRIHILPEFYPNSFMHLGSYNRFEQETRSPEMMNCANSALAPLHPVAS